MRLHQLAIAGALLAATVVSGGLYAETSTSDGNQEPLGTSAGEAPFLAENAAAMDTMMAGMAVRPSGDIDADFVAMMIPHHQGAVDMAVAYLRYGRNEQLIRLAQEIVVEQQQEIAAMRLALGQPLPPATAAPTQPGAAAPSSPPPAHQHGHSGMQMPAK